MEEAADDIAYGYIQLGLDDGVPLAEVQAVLVRAEVYRYRTKARIAHVRRYVEFFMARDRLGGFDAPFASIRKAYRRKAMELHPDRNAGDRASEDALKEINLLYAVVEKINQQAKVFYKRSAAEQREIEQQARDTTAREAGVEERAGEAAQAKQTHYRPAHTASSARKYFAASVPRSVRTARLSYLPVHTIIGFRSVKRGNDIAYIFDYFMLPEDQFLRAKGYLSAPESINPALRYGKFDPPFVLKDTKEVVVPESVEDREAFARAYFKREFGI